MERWRHARVPLNEMVRMSKRCRSTIFCGLERNHFFDPCMPKCDDDYGVAAQVRMASRRAGVRKLIRHLDLPARVIERLKNGWTPERIGNRMRHGGASLRVCRQTIYRHISSCEEIRDDPRSFSLSRFSASGFAPALQSTVAPSIVLHVTQGDPDAA